MTQLVLIFIVAVIAAVCALCGINPVKLVLDVQKAYANRPKTIKRIAAEKSGKKKKNILTRMLSQTSVILADTGRGGKVEFFQTLSVVCAFIGVIVGVSTGNVFLPIVLGAIGFILPIVYVLVTQSVYEKRLNKHLYTSLQLINVSYRESGILQTAIRSNTAILISPMREIFQRCDGEINFLNVDVETAIRNMRGKIKNQTFHEWCDAMIRCQNDPSLYGQLDCIEDLRDTDDVQQDLDAKVRAPIFMTAFFMALSICFGPFIAAAFPMLATDFSRTVQGQTVVAVIALMNLFAIIRIARVARPVRLVEEGDDQ